MTTPDAFIKQLTDVIRTMRMDVSARTLVRERLSAYADMHEVIAATKQRFSLLSFLDANALRAGFAVLLVLVGTGGVAYASEDTLPGDTLYPVKVSFVEPLESAILVDAKSRATWNAMLAERRLAEAATLATRGELTEDTRVELEERFALHAERSSRAADEVSEEGDIATALAVRSDLEARLVAHADLFSYLTLAESPDAPPSETKKLMLAVAEVRDEVTAARQGAEAIAQARVVAYADTEIDAAADATEAVANAVRDSDGPVSGGIEARLTAARVAIAQARTSLASDEEGGAYVAAQAAGRLTHEASILAKNTGIVALGDSAAPMPAAAKQPGASADMSSTTATTTATSTPEEEDADEKSKNSSQMDTPSSETHAAPASSFNLNIGGVNIGL